MRRARKQNKLRQQYERVAAGRVASGRETTDGKMKARQRLDKEARAERGKETNKTMYKKEVEDAVMGAGTNNEKATRG